MTKIVLGLLIAIILCVAVVTAASPYKVVYEPSATSVLKRLHNAAEYGECMRKRKEVYHLLRGERKLNDKNNREIEMIKRLLQMMKVGVHSRHAEKDSLVRLLTRLLNRLLGVRATNLGRLRPLEKRYKEAKQNCKELKRDMDKNNRAQKEVKDAVRNQKGLKSSLETCEKNNKACTRRKTRLIKQNAKQSAVLKALKAKHAAEAANRAKCGASLTKKKNAVASQRATNTKLRADIKNIKHHHKKCRGNVQSTTQSIADCEASRTACKTKKTSLEKDLETLQSIGGTCTTSLKSCQEERLLHAAKCKKTTQAATGLERRYGTCANQLEHCQAKVATNKELLPKCQENVQQVSKKLADIKQKHANVAKELETFKPPVRKPVKPIAPFKPKYPSPSKHKATCQSTGDPHYYNFARKRFDIYGYYGNYELVRIPGEFEVETTIQANWAIWRNRGLNTWIGVRLGSNVVYGRYASWTLNGKRLNLGIGKTVTLKGGHQIRRTSTTHYMFLHRSGAYLNVHGASYRGFIYHNVYTGIPRNWVPFVSGFCKSQSAGAAVNRNFINSVAIRSASDPRHLIGKSFVAPVIPKNHAFHKIAWKSAALKASAEKYCHTTLKLKGVQYMNCLLDAKVVGKITGATVYKGVANDLHDNSHIEKATADSAPGAMLREISRMKNLLAASSKNLLVLGNHLKNYHNKKLAKDISNLSNRLSAENAFLNQLSGDFTKELLK